MWQKIWSWLKFPLAVATAIAAAVFFSQSGRHVRRQEKLGQKARELEQDQHASMAKAIATRKRAQAAKARAEAAYKEGEARINELEANDSSLAERVRAYNERRAKRLRERRKTP